MDIISIKDLVVYAFHGALPEENKLGQNFIISAKLFTNTRPAGRTDTLDKTINYAEVCHFINDFTRKHTVKLIETAAEQLAAQLLLNFSLIKKISLTIKKPSAPVGLPLKYTAVTITRCWHEVFISFGSNIDNKEKYINDGIRALNNIPQIKNIVISDLYDSSPYGEVAQDNFINGVLKLSTLLSPHELLNILHAVEKAAGRKRTIHWGPRTLDLDILFYDEKIIYDEELIVPHPDMLNRDFVMVPLQQIAPYKIHPLTGKTITQLAQEIPSTNIHIINKE